MSGHLLLLAHEDDPAIELLRRALPQQLVHVAITDVSRPGWRCEVGRPELATASAGGCMLRAEQIAAVLCRIHGITPQDLGHLHADDREFAAREMHAFLKAWLDQFGARVCNEPGSASLAGPVWLPWRWRWLALRLGIPALPVAASVDSQEMSTVLVAAGRVFGTHAAALMRHALGMARAVRATLLAVHFVKRGDWCLASAEPCPPLDVDSAQALLSWAFPPSMVPSATASVP